LSSSGKKAAKPKAAKTKSKPKASAPKKAVVEKPKKAAKPKKADKAEAPAPKGETVKLGPAPMATVSARHLDSMHERPARGFSWGELSSAGVTGEVARRGDLSIDVRRRSVVEGNVEALKGWLGGGQGVETRPAAVAAPTKKK